MKHVISFNDIQRTLSAFDQLERELFQLANRQAPESYLFKDAHAKVVEQREILEASLEPPEAGE